MKPKVKFTIILVVEFVAIAILLLLVFFAGKKSYDVTFDLNGGTLISGSLTQRVTQGQSANPPSVVKDGHYLRGWSGSYNGVTSNRTIKAIWEYETTAGIIYSETENTNFCEIVGCYSEIGGDVYIGAYHNDIQVLGITDGAFARRDRITAMYLLDGILKIGSSAFEDCTALEVVDLPRTLTRLGERAFAGCESLKEIELPEGLIHIGAEAFAGCVSLEKITIPSTVKSISRSAFEGCVALREVKFAEGEKEITIEDAEDIEDSGFSLEEIFGEGFFGSSTHAPVKITVPSKVTLIEERAFANCPLIEKMILPEALETIKAGAFAGCTALSEVVMFNATETIEAGAFDSEFTKFLVTFKEEARPHTWADGWKHENAVIEWEYELPKLEEDDENATKK